MPSELLVRHDFAYSTADSFFSFKNGQGEPSFANVPINFILEDTFDLYGLRYLTDAGYELHNESPILNVQADEPTAARITEITASPTTTAR